MKIKPCLLFIFSLNGFFIAYSQPCTSLGQNPGTSFPVCGTATFTQNTVPLCGGVPIPGPCASTDPITDVNPYWYRFTCYVSGSLSFVITPFNLADDYDWQLFDVTGRNPMDVYTDPTLFVACNWSGFGGATGASSAGTTLTNCAGNYPLFSRMPSLVAGHNYLLLVSHWTSSQSGYRLSFTMGQPGEGTAAITDPSNPVPEVNTASVSCDATQVVVRFNKKVKCNSFTLTGSDFVFTPAAAIASVTGYGCASGFDMDSVLITLTAPLAPGNYRVEAANGTDGNTLLDNCDRPVVVGDDASFTVVSQPPLPMGNVNQPPCLPTSITLTFTDPVLCNSIAADGSDFVITGPSTVMITSAAAVTCINGQTNSITLQLTGPILATGPFQVQVVAGTDGNTLIGQCARIVNAGNSTQFILPPQPAIAMGTLANLPSCIPSSVTLTFADPVFCNSIAANGSDFIVTGPSAVTVSGATAVNCDANGQTNTITIQFTAPVLVSGPYQVIAAAGSDGNTLVGQCNRQVTAGSNTQFVVPPQPALSMGIAVQPGCSPASITLNFADNILCSSIANNGTDFIITGPSAVTVTSAAGTCDANGETNSITLQLTQNITVSGNYQVQMVTGSDGNTLIGNCNRRTTAGELALFTIPPAFPVPMDSIVPVACSPSSLKLVFRSPVRCSSIAPNGSDFIVAGPSPVGVTSATGTCDANGFTSSIDIQLASPVVAGGSYQVQLVAGNDGNTLLSDCNRQTPVGSSVSFIASDTVSAEFQYQVKYGCERDTITFSHDGQHNVNQWTWTVNGNAAGTSQTFTQSFSAASQNQVQLVVSNGLCSDTYSTPVILDNKVTVGFKLPESACPEDTIRFINTSTGQIDYWQWTFGNGSTSTIQYPPVQIYPLTGTETLYTITLVAGSNNGCQAIATGTLKVLSSCFIAVPTAFTPNNDGRNDYLYPLNALKAENLDFKVFNRWGQLVFHSKDWTKKWDGKAGGIPQATGVYVWMLEYTHKDTRQRVSMKGTTTLIR